MAGPDQITEMDRRYMAAAIRYSYRNLGATGTNPSVATLIVSDSGQVPRIIGRGVTAVGGRPHAEAEAIAQAGDAARGATAYVTLEPCAHHGRTPPCAEALVTAGISRVVGAAADPDPRVSGKGYEILRKAGVEVVEGVLADQAADAMAGYLSRSSRSRPYVTLKLAVSSDGKIGKKGAGQVAITGKESRNRVHVMRAQSDAILIGIDTVLEDDPDLRCRLPGMASRSPARIVLDSGGRMPNSASMLKTVAETPVMVAVGDKVVETARSKLRSAGASILSCETADGRIALPELLDDLAARGIQNLMVEGGAAVAQGFLEEGLVDHIVLFTGPRNVGADGITSPITASQAPEGFSQTGEAVYGEDLFVEWTREN